MLRNTAAIVLALAATLPAAAQELPQASSEWFTDAQAVIEAWLAQKAVSWAARCSGRIRRRAWPE